MRSTRWPFAPVALLAVVVMAGCTTGRSDDDDTPEPTCDNTTAPEVEVQAVDQDQPVGFPVLVTAQVTDPDGINSVSLYYRTEGSETGFNFSFMSNDETGSEDIYQGEIPADVVADPGVDFYVRATDRVSGCAAESFAPEAAPDEAYHFTTQLSLQPLPFFADFEPAEGVLCGEEGAELEDLGWTVVIDSFPQGVHAWRTDDRSPLSGTCSTSHSEGIPGGFWECPPPDGVGTIVRQNWLISPPLDFADKESIAVRWFERHLESGICAEAHKLYVSTGLGNPGSGDFVEVQAELPFPSSAWSSSAWYDLSAYAGSDQVFVALFYEGGSAGRWQIDDFYVGEPLADLVLHETSDLSADVAPGSTEVALSVTIANTSTEYASTELVGTLTTADSGLAITSAETTFAPLQPGEQTAGAAAFSFDVLASHPDNAFLDFAVVLDDGDGHSWTVPIRLLMGEDSLLSVTYSAPTGSGLELEVGYGPSAAPTFALTVSAEELDGDPWEDVITEHSAVLPPGAGAARWYVKATNNGAADASLDSVVFRVGGVDTTAEATDVPVTVPADDSVLVRVPPPPVLILAESTTSPDPVAPGSTVSIDSTVLRNDGQPTSGGLSCQLASSDPDVSGLDATPVTFGSTAIDAGEERSSDGAFGLTVAASHTDNSPVALTLLCNDTVETLVVPFDLAVPYAHPVVDFLRVDDSSGNGDDYADPGEVVGVYLNVVNDGAFDTAGALTAQVSAGSGSTALFTLTSPSTLEFGATALASGGAAEATSAVQVDIDSSAMLGDTVVLDVVFSAGSDTWSETVVLEVTGLPWIDCNTADDPQGDVVGSGTFDIKGCAYRSDGTLLQVRLDSYEPFTTAGLFVDFIFFQVNSLFTIESVGGNTQFEDGCVFGDDVPQTAVPVSVELDPTGSATARIATSDLGIIGNATQVAFGASSCPDIWFCDTYPDPALSFNIKAGAYDCDEAGFVTLDW